METSKKLLDAGNQSSPSLSLFKSSLSLFLFFEALQSKFKLLDREIINARRICTYHYSESP